jgi:hypothetical protein
MKVISNMSIDELDAYTMKIASSLLTNKEKFKLYDEIEERKELLQTSAEVEFSAISEGDFR